MIKLVALAAGLLSTVGPLMGPIDEGNGMPANALVTDSGVPITTHLHEYIIT